MQFTYPGDRGNEEVCTLVVEEARDDDDCDCVWRGSGWVWPKVLGNHGIGYDRDRAGVQGGPEDGVLLACV